MLEFRGFERVFAPDRWAFGQVVTDLTLTDISVSAVPVPAAFWLFGTALIGLIGFSKRRKAT
ncbi:MAG: PEP-CTERM sorting domain-containing protein [Gammaproteobacteria bacterium]|nr:PEP-CTERM sorting domain-containing protein [Gammaproteobacteria bacterium]